MTDPRVFVDPSELTGLTVERIDGVCCEVARPAGTPRDNVIVLHGIFSSSSELHSYVSPLLHRGFAVYLVNFPLHGPDYDRKKVHTIRAADCLDAARRVLHAVGGGFVVESFGGLMAQALAHDPLVRGTVLLASSPPPGVKFTASPLLVIRLLPILFQLLFFRTFMYPYSFCRRYIFNMVPEAKAREWYAQMHPESVWLVWDQVRYRIAVHPELPHGPVLVCVGAEDPGLPPMVQRKIAELWRGDYIEFENHSHMFTDEPGWQFVCQRILEWIDAKATAASARATPVVTTEASS